MVAPTSRATALAIILTAATAQPVLTPAATAQVTFTTPGSEGSSFATSVAQSSSCITGSICASWFDLRNAEGDTPDFAYGGLIEGSAASANTLVASGFTFTFPGFPQDAAIVGIIVTIESGNVGGPAQLLSNITLTTSRGSFTAADEVWGVSGGPRVIVLGGPSNLLGLPTDLDPSDLDGSTVTIDVFDAGDSLAGVASLESVSIALHWEVTTRVDSISPTAFAPSTGGVVTLTGSGLNFIDNCLFGSEPALAINPVSTTEFQCTAPPRGAGAVLLTLEDSVNGALPMEYDFGWGSVGSVTHTGFPRNAVNLVGVDTYDFLIPQPDALASGAGVGGYDLGVLASAGIDATEFGFDLPDGAVVRGLAATFDRVMYSGGPVTDLEVALTTPFGLGSELFPLVTVPAPAWPGNLAPPNAAWPGNPFDVGEPGGPAEVSITTGLTTFGGATELWGFPQLPTSALEEPVFGVRFIEYSPKLPDQYFVVATLSVDVTTDQIYSAASSSTRIAGESGGQTVSVFGLGFPDPAVSDAVLGCRFSSGGDEIRVAAAYVSETEIECTPVEIASVFPSCAPGSCDVTVEVTIDDFASLAPAGPFTFTPAVPALSPPLEALLVLLIGAAACGVLRAPGRSPAR